jgi:penicillin-binding protein-related factor A (putative recombinase)
MNEAKLTSKFAHWVRGNWKGGSFAFEAKIVKAPKKSLAFSSFQPHQLPNLLKTTRSGIYHKIPDAGWLNPFDGFYLKGEAYVVIFWYEARKQKVGHMIDIESFIKFQSKTTKKSIRQTESEEIATYVFELS